MRRKVFLLSPIIVVLFTFIMMPFLPQKIEIHYNMWGEANRWGSKYELFIVAGLSIAFNLLMELLSYVNMKMGEDTVENHMPEKKKFFYTCGIAFSFLLIADLFSIALKC